MKIEISTRHLSYPELLEILGYLDLDAIPDETYRRVIEIKNFLQESQTNQLIVSGK